MRYVASTTLSGGRIRFVKTIGADGYAASLTADVSEAKVYDDTYVAFLAYGGGCRVMHFDEALIVSTLES